MISPRPEPSEAFIAAFERDGYVVVENLFSAAEVDAMRTDADFVLELIINSSLANGRQSRRLDIRAQDSAIVVRKIQPVIDLSVVFADLARDTRLLDVLEVLIGEEPVLMEEKLNYKQPVDLPSRDTFSLPDDDDRFPVHHDWAYYRMNGYPVSTTSTAVAIDDCWPSNGTLRVFPGTHRLTFEHERVRNGLEVQPGAIDPDTGVDLELRAGSAVFFHSCLVHTSRPNRSGAARRLMIFSHYPRSAGMGHDARNGPNRLRESPWEWRYQQLVSSGAYRDQFKARSKGDS